MMITLKEIAKNLNVSVSTVSKALNDSPEISPKTKNRIKKAAEFYNYRPNKIALSLRNNKTKIIGVIIPDILNRFYAKVLYGIEKEATRNGYNLITCISNESLEKEQQALELLSNGSVDGFILAVSEETQLKNETKHFKKILNQNIPIVMFHRVVDSVICQKVEVNNEETTYDLTKDFVLKGKKNIAFISNMKATNIRISRENGYKKAIKEHHLNEIILSIRKEEDIQSVITQFLKDNSEIEAIISGDNTTGVIATNMASINLKQNISKKLTVVGFSSETIANHSIPKLSVVREHPKKIGATSVNLLMNDLMYKKKINTKSIIKTSVIYH